MLSNPQSIILLRSCQYFQTSGTPVFEYRWALTWQVFLLWLWGRRMSGCIALTNQTRGALFYYHIPVKPDSSSTESQKHNQLHMGSSLVIMPYSQFLNTQLSYSFHSQNALWLLMCCSMPCCCSLSAGPERLTETQQFLSGQKRNWLLFLNLQPSLSGHLWNCAHPDRWCLCHSFRLPTHLLSTHESQT